MGPELYDIYYNNTFVCRVLKVLLKDELNFLVNALSLDSERTDFTIVRYVEPEPKKAPKDKGE